MRVFRYQPEMYSKTDVIYRHGADSTKISQTEEFQLASLIYQEQKQCRGLHTLCDVAQRFPLHSESGNVLTIPLVDTLRERSYWKSQLQTALCGRSKSNLALWLQT